MSLQFVLGNSGCGKSYYLYRHLVDEAQLHPEKVYIEYTKDVPPGFISNDYEIITDQPERIKALYERKRKEFDEVGDVL